MRVLLVASSGGHLQHLLWLAPWWRGLRRRWVTFDTPDAVAALAGEDVIWAWHPTNRHLPNLARNAARAHATLARGGVDLVVSAGAAVALPWLAAARMRGVPALHLEVVDRCAPGSSPSWTTAVARAWVDAVAVPAEQVAWASPRAGLVGARAPVVAVGSPFAAGAVRPTPGPVRTALVAAGTHHQPHARLEAVAAQLAAAGVAVTLQTALPERAPAGVVAWPIVAPEVLAAALAAADAVVVHGGPGLVAAAWAAGHRPVVLPRHAPAEHVDDHQRRWARTLGEGARVADGPDAVADAVAWALGGTRAAGGGGLSAALPGRFGALAEAVVAGTHGGSPRATVPTGAAGEAAPTTSPTTSPAAAGVRSHRRS